MMNATNSPVKAPPSRKPVVPVEEPAVEDTLAGQAHTKLAQARRELSARMIERDDEIETVLVALVAGENCLFVGPPGTGKSMLANGVCELLDGQRFSYLLTKFTAPEEVFGPVSLKHLTEDDRYVRVTTGKLPCATVAFLDEIFKASSAILNTMLTALNEKVFDAGNGPAAIPLRMCVAASNEWPGGEGQQELGALFDRFLLRRTVKPIGTSAGRKRLRFDRAEPAPLTVRLTEEELEAARQEAGTLPWSAEAMEAYDQIVRELNREGIFPGDRRERKAIGVVQAAAWLSGSAEVLNDHLSILSEVLWDSPEEQPGKCANIVAKISNPVHFHVNTLLVEVEQIISTADPKNLAAMSAAATKLGEVSRKLRTLKGSPKADKATKYVDERIKALKQAAMDAV